MIFRIIAHASTYGVAQFIQERLAGFSMHRELFFLFNAISEPERPVAALIGGLKVSTKIDLLTNLIDRVDKLLIGGAMVYTFYRALGHCTGDSFVEEKSIEVANAIMQKAAERNVVLRLATDCTVIPTRAFNMKFAKTPAERLTLTPSIEYCPRNVEYIAMPEHWTGVDIGPKTVTDFGRELEFSRTIIINGKT